MKMKRFFLVLLAMLLVLSVFTACDDDDDSSASTAEDDDDSDDNSRVCTAEDYEIIYTILTAFLEGQEDDELRYTTAIFSETTETHTFISDFTYTYDRTNISVTIKSGSTAEYEYVYNSSTSNSSVGTYDIDATVEGTSRSLYVVKTAFIVYFYSFDKVVLDGVELKGVNAFIL